MSLLLSIIVSTSLIISGLTLSKDYFKLSAYSLTDSKSD
nr:MAG TPA: hypothetical protein [Caudoviricetes sp.]DAH97407.1 MAG TPA: hypothetical protein [Bacteriophage sp.]DAL32730.1 MAG TPA_asm: hypothetical protein [Bacteriophage sp.]DAM05358.1 MAG TPA: hypothetical protein [Caudoviricetes sp.]DAO24117.1 MAG TPA: hypothetical protein [Caudoviricetes sp.]